MRYESKYYGHFEEWGFVELMFILLVFVYERMIDLIGNWAGVWLEFGSELSLYY